MQRENFTNHNIPHKTHTTMKEIINIIEHEMGTCKKHHTAADYNFQLTLMAIATILVSLMEWLY